MLSSPHLEIVFHLNKDTTHIIGNFCASFALLLYKIKALLLSWFYSVVSAVKTVFRGRTYTSISQNTVHTWQVSFQHRFVNIFIKDNVLRKRPLITGCYLIGVSLEDRFYCTTFNNIRFSLVYVINEILCVSVCFQRETLMRELERERMLRMDAEQRLHEMAGENDSSKSRLHSLQEEFRK